jgi:hypothetical protein
MTDPSETAEHAGRSNLRERLLPGQAYEEEIAAALDCSRRTVQRLNLPFKRIGKRRTYSISEAREALRRHA